MAVNEIIVPRGNRGQLYLKDLSARLRQFVQHKLELIPCVEKKGIPYRAIHPAHQFHTTHDDVEKIRQWTDEIRKGEDDGLLDIAGGFSAGIPIVYIRNHGEWLMSRKLTYARWVNDEQFQLEATPSLSSTKYLFDECPPPIRHFLNSLKAQINDAQATGKWREHDLDVQSEGSMTTGIHFIHLWQILDVKTIPFGDGDTYDLTVAPFTGLQGYSKLRADGENELSHRLETLSETCPFITESNWESSSTIAGLLCRYSMSLNTQKFDGWTPAQDQIIIQFAGNGQFHRMRAVEGDTSLAHGLWYEWSVDPFDEFDSVIEWKEMGLRREHTRFVLDAHDVRGRRHCGYPREVDPVNNRIYGRSESRATGVTGLIQGDWNYPSVEIAEEIMLANMWATSAHPEGGEDEDLADEEWGGSSRFIPAWKDKRKIKLIDKTSGEPPYWSDIIRCRICNGQTKVLLKKQTTTLLFDCQHCGEAEAVDASHLAEGADWPASKTRKVVDAK